MMFQGRRIAVVEDDGLMGASLVQRLELEGARVTWLRHVARAVGELRTPRHPIDAVICDIRLPDGSGEELFKELTATSTPPPFLFMTGQGGIDQAVRLLRQGAADYVTKPFDMAQLLARLARLLPPARAHETEDAFFGVSPLARRLDEMVRQAAAQDAPIVLRGAAGTGKQAAARRLHALSDRAHAPFVSVNFARDEDPLAALTTVIDEVGAGDVFLNAVDRANPHAQDAIVRILDRAADARFIAAVAPTIDDHVKGGTFRTDLYFALAQTVIDLPPLAERPDDAAWLAEDTFKVLNARRAKPLRGLADTTLVAIRAHTWPGNGRELRSRLARAVEHAEGEWLQPIDVFPERRVASPFPSLSSVRESAERAHIITALARADGQILEAAKLLGISRTTLWEKMQKFGL